MMFSPLTSRRTNEPGSGTSSARPTASQSRKKISSRSQAWTASSWYAIAGRSVALRKGARMFAMASGETGAGRAGRGGRDDGQVGTSFEPPDRSRTRTGYARIEGDA